MSPLDLRGRHAAERPSTPLGFICPACGAANTGRLEDGCTACGSGKPGKFVGVDPLYTPPSAAPAPLPATIDVTPQERADLFTAVERAYRTWFAMADLSEATNPTFAAFAAGYAAALNASPMPTPDAPPVPAVALPGTAESRTIIAALSYFIDQVLNGNPEECQTGEWLSIAEAQALLKRLEAA